MAEVTIRKDRKYYNRSHVSHHVHVAYLKLHNNEIEVMRDGAGLCCF